MGGTLARLPTTRGAMLGIRLERALSITNNHRPSLGTGFDESSTGRAVWPP